MSPSIRQEFRPKNPSPARWAAERSKSGTASVNPRAWVLRARAPLHAPGVRPDDPGPPPLGRRTLQERPSVREPARLDLRPQGLFELLPQPEQPPLYDLVVVPLPGVPRHPPAAPRGLGRL